MEKATAIEGYITKYINVLIDFLPTLICALLILVFGWWIINLISKKLAKIFEKRALDISLRKFLVSLIKISLRVILIVIVISQLGIETSSFIAILGAAGLAVGLALQGSLSNFAGGIILLVLRPFKVGDWVETQNISGSVTEIHLFYTMLTTATNQLAIIPNTNVSNGSIINYSTLGNRKDFLTFNIGYNSDIKKAKDIALKVMTEKTAILEDPAPQVFVTTLGESYIGLSARFWATNADFWDCHFEVIEEVQLKFSEAGIELPFPHRVIEESKEG